jgi:hypothetical protein
VPTFLSWRVLTLPKIFYFPSSETNRMPSSRSYRTKRDSPPSNGGIASPGQAVVQEVVARELDSLPRFVQQHDNQWSKSCKSHRITKSLCRSLVTRLSKFPSRNSSNAQFPNGKFLITWNSLRNALPFGV